MVGISALIRKDILSILVFSPPLPCMQTKKRSRENTARWRMICKPKRRGLRMKPTFPVP